MRDKVSLGGVLNALVPISRFNKGEANKIFEEVRETGFKIVLKNNFPACVLLTPDAYDQMLETIENYRLLIEADKRLANAKAEDFIPADIAMQELGIRDTDLNGIDVELE